MGASGTTTAASRIFDIVEQTALRTPDAPAALFPRERLTYSALAEASLVWARRLRAAGVRHGDRVGVLLGEASPTYVSLLVAVPRLGAVIVPLNARYKAAELSHVIGQAGMSLLITERWFAPVLAESMLPGACRVVVLDEDSAVLAQEDRVSVEEVRAVQDGLDPSTPARIIYTSGTTAHPKGCVHTHGAVVAQAEATAERLRLTAEDRYWTPLPLFHTAGWTMFAAFARGATLVHGGRFEPAPSLAQIAAERCTVLFPGFETIWLAVLALPDFDDVDLGAVRAVICVGVPERLRLMEARLPHAPQLSNTGCTEVSGWLSVCDPGDSLQERTETCGKPFAGMEVRIVDPETRADVPDGAVGELLFRGPCRLREYFGDPEGTAASIDAAGWFATGDLLSRDPHGNLVYVGRVKDMLKVGGENVAAAEIEGFLADHATIHIVQVVSAPDAKYGEVPAAFVELKPGAQTTERELIEHCVGRISTFKVPRYVRFVDEWPMSGTKIKKVVLREIIAADLQRAGITEAPPVRTRRTG